MALPRRRLPARSPAAGSCAAAGGGLCGGRRSGRVVRTGAAARLAPTSLPAGNRSAQPAQHAARAPAGGQDGACAGRRPRLAVRLPGHAARPLEGPARHARGLRTCARGAGGPAAGHRRGARRGGPGGLAGGQGGERLRRRPAGSPLRDQLRGRGPTGAVRARAARPGGASPGPARGVRPRRLGGAVEGDAGRRQSPGGPAAPGSGRRGRLSRRLDEGDGGADGGARARSGPGDRDGEGGPRARPRAVPHHARAGGGARGSRGGARRYRGARMTVKLPDGSALQLDEGATGADAARAIGEGLARAALGIRVNGQLRDLSAPLEDGDEIEIVTSKDGEAALWLVRHDAAHVLATAVTELYPGVKISIGPPIDDGFYYDFEFPDGVKVSEDDFERIEAKMREHVKADEPFERSVVSVEEALERFRAEEQDYKVELIQDLVRDNGVETVSLYRNGPFTDLCRGPHGPSTKRIKAFKLTSVAGAYWRGKADNQMLTRVYGTAFLSKEDLAEHLRRLEQARARDHRKLGRELDLFMFSELSAGSPFWLPAGTHIWNELTRLWREENVRRGY